MNKQILKQTAFVGLFLIPFVPFLVSSSLFFPFITTKAFAWRTIVEVVFAAWLLLALVEPQYRPRRTPILYAVAFFLLAIGLSDLLGAEPLKSFWSNFERMEGYITLLHLGAYFLVIGSLFQEIDWKRWWNTSLVASGLMVVYCLFQVAGVLTIQQGGVRVDGTFGNAIYLAVYMLFHIFIALFYMLRSWKRKELRYAYGLLIFFQALTLYFTATRGAILGLIGGLLIFALFNLRNRENLSLKKLSISLIVGVLVVSGGFFALRHTKFVLESPVLSRFATLSVDQLKSQGRYFVWPIALKGFEDKPILGWGQENFNFIFEKYYRPEMYAIEPWFDRAHNIFLDWLSAGGILGLLSYLSLYGAVLYLIFKGSFSIHERSILFALLAAYFFHNFFVFDHLISYILFFSLLAYVHGRSTGEPLWKSVPENSLVPAVALPLVALSLAFTLYYVNWKPLVANTNLIVGLSAIQNGDFATAVSALPKAYQASYLGRTEATEQAAGNAVQIFSSSLPVAERNDYYNFLRKALLGKDGKFLGDARHELVTGSLLSSVGSLDEALTHLERAKTLIPGKQQVYFELGALYINQGKYAEALDVFRQAYEMAPAYDEAQIIYLIGAIYAGNTAVEDEMTKLIPERARVFDDRIAGAYYNKGRLSKVVEIVSRRKALDPDHAATYDQYLQQLLK